MTKEEIKAVIELFNEIESKCNEIDNKVWIGFQLGAQVRIKKEHQQSAEDARLFYIVCKTEYINGDKLFNLSTNKEGIEDWLRPMYRENQIELVDKNSIHEPKFQIGNVVYLKERGWLEKIKPYFVVHIENKDVYIDECNYYSTDSIKYNENNLELYEPTRKL